MCPSSASVAAIANARQSSINIHNGPVFCADLIKERCGKRLLLLVAHHLVVDLASWRVIWEDIETLITNPAVQLGESATFTAWTAQPSQVEEDTSDKVDWPRADLECWGVAL
jgi:hypothetical protein